MDGVKDGPVALEDGLSREHGGHSGSLLEASQLSGCNEGPGKAGIQRQGYHLAAQGCDAPIGI